MLGYYNYSVILTYLSMIFATIGFSNVLKGGENSIFAALICLLFSGVCDMFDGAIAKRCNRNDEEKLFGIEIDSLVDLVAFGALPAVITLKLAESSVFSAVGAGLILLSSVIRLGYFNVQEFSRDRTEKLLHYTGLPVTTVAVFFPALLLLNVLFKLPYAIWAPSCLVLLAALEVSRLPVKKPYGKAKAVVVIVGAVMLTLLCLFGKQIGAQ
ncbi:MAG: CDP-alcohol phosphatidyltransferase family protein [Clostridia bacterium]|nr:CDP-alcohol phosphatidyltransferase family protein [Clostridia bacterium]